MVFNGRPSTGCYACRQRKVKCDDKRPNCTRCERAGRVCPGYRDPFERILRDQTSSVVNRTGTKGSIGTSKRQARTQESAAAKQNASTAIVEKVPPPLFQHIEERAHCHFIANYIWDSPTAGSGINEYFGSLIREDSSGTFKKAMEACALASLSAQVGGGHSLRVKVMELYGQALSMAALDIQDPERNKRDDTLGAVLLFGLLDNLIPSDSSIYQPAKHIFAAVDLVRLRGHEQLQTARGRSMFNRVKLAMLRLLGMSNGEAPPDHAFWDQPGVLRWRNDFDRLMWDSMLLQSRVNNVLKHTPGTADNAHLVLSKMRECQEALRKLKEWNDRDYSPELFKMEPVAWVHTVSDVDLETSPVYPGPIYAVSCFSSAVARQSGWVVALTLHIHVIRCAAWLCYPNDYRTTLEYSSSAQQCADMIVDIIGTTPYMLGWFQQQQQQGKLIPANMELPRFMCGNDRHPTYLGGDLICWVLGAIVLNDFSTNSQRLWARARLRHIYQTCGLHQARTQSELTFRDPSMRIAMDLDNMALADGPAISHNTAFPESGWNFRAKG